MSAFKKHGNQPRRNNKPYGRQSFPQDKAGSVNDKWGHDLFNPLTDAVAPAVNFGAIQDREMPIEIHIARTFTAEDDPLNKRRTLSGTMAADLISKAVMVIPQLSEDAPLPNRPNPHRQRPQQRHASAGASLLDRLNNAPPTSKREQREQQEQRQAKIKGSAIDKSKILNLDGPTVVLVENLVDGTTADDVKAAFADFGKISNASVAQQTPDTVTVKLIFDKRQEAQEACKKLNNVLADGRHLVVRIDDKAQSQSPPKGPSALRAFPNGNNRAHAPRQQQPQPQQQQQDASGPSLFQRLGGSKAAPRKASNGKWANGNAKGGDLLSRLSNGDRMETD